MGKNKSKIERRSKGKMVGKAALKRDIKQGLHGKKTAGEEKATQPSESEDDGAWMGGVASDEDDPLISGDSDEDVGSNADVSGSEGEGDEEEDGDEGPAGPEPGDDDQSGAAQSQMLARVMSGQQSGDIATLKQRIKDDAALLSNWRNARKTGETRTREQVLKSLVVDCSTYFGYSEELAEYFLLMFSAEQAIEFFEANEKKRPLTIRTNSLKARRPALIQALTARKVQLDPIGDWTKVGLKIYESSVPVGATPEYLGGHYMIQSASSLVPVMALAPQQDETVLDMAAAPGGKTTHIGQLMRNTGTLFANDMKKDRCKSLAANVHRMGLTNTIVCQLDGRKLKEHLPRMDRVLLDAPCSGSGIIARDPSVKVKRGSKDFEENSTLQKELLAVAIDLVNAESKTGGYIVYSTCSLSIEENEAVIDHALRTRNVELVSFSSAVNFGVEGMTKFRDKRFHPSMNHCRRYYPHVHNMDGFFVAKLKKTSNAIPERVKKQRFNKATKEEVTTWGEEKWTPEMMETVADIKEPGAPEDTKPKNKKERKRSKRQLVLAARAAASTGVGAAAAAAAGVPAAAEDAKQAAAAAAEVKAGEKTEETKPVAAPKKGKLKRKSLEGKSPADAVSPASDTQQTDASPVVDGQNKKKRRKSV